jgi:hypothetical protein
MLIVLIETVIGLYLEPTAVMKCKLSQHYSFTPNGALERPCLLGLLVSVLRLNENSHNIREEAHNKWEGHKCRLKLIIFVV